MYTIHPFNQLHQIHVKKLHVNNFVYYHLLRLKVIHVNANRGIEFPVPDNVLKVNNTLRLFSKIMVILLCIYIYFFVDESPFLLVMRGYQIIDVSLTPGDRTTGHIVPIVGIEGGTQVDYDTETKSLYWVEGLKVNEEDESVNSVNVNTFFFLIKYIKCILLKFI